MRRAIATNRRTAVALACATAAGIWLGMGSAESAGEAEPVPVTRDEVKQAQTALVELAILPDSTSEEVRQAGIEAWRVLRDYCAEHHSDTLCD